MNAKNYKVNSEAEKLINNINNMIDFDQVEKVQQEVARRNKLKTTIKIEITSEEK